MRALAGIAKFLVANLGAAAAVLAIMFLLSGAPGWALLFGAIAWVLIGLLMKNERAI